MEREEVHVCNVERGGCGVGNGLDSEHGAGNGLDREHVSVVDVDKRSVSNVPPPNTSKDNKLSTATTTRTQTNSCNDNGIHKMSRVTRPACWMPETIQ